MASSKGLHALGGAIGDPAHAENQQPSRLTARSKRIHELPAAFFPFFHFLRMGFRHGAGSLVSAVNDLLDGIRSG